MKEIYLGIDIGGTAVKLGLVDRKGTIRARSEHSVNFDGYKTPIMDTVCRAARSFLESNGAKPLGIGVSATGQINSISGCVAGVGGNFPGWEDTPVASVLNKEFGVPVTVANDANCMCLGEIWTGAAKGFTDVIGITIGTGIGGGILTGGHLLEGARGLGGEIGHLRIHADGNVVCGCGAYGCWEKYASTTALVKSAEIISPEYNSGKVIFRAAKAGDPQILALLDHWMDEICTGISSLVHIFNPQIILIGGGVSAQRSLLIEPLAEKVRNSVMPAYRKNLIIKAAELQNDAGIVGGVYYFLNQKRGRQ